jgi:regulator of nucleoside diphosphate kinase
MVNRQIYITESDMERLQDLLTTPLKFGTMDKAHLKELEEALLRAKVVPAGEMPPDVITMNSKVRLRHLDSEEELVYALVFPHEADLKAHRLSVLAPLGTALIGYRGGDQIIWKGPGGIRQLSVQEVMYQPEAAGDEKG